MRREGRKRAAQLFPIDWPEAFRPRHDRGVVIRKHAKIRPVERERRTTGSMVRTETRTGERVPDGVEIEAFPEEVYRAAPILHEHWYTNRNSRTYIVGPHERRVMEESGLSRSQRTASMKTIGLGALAATLIASSASVAPLSPAAVGGCGHRAGPSRLQRVRPLL